MTHTHNKGRCSCRWDDSKRVPTKDCTIHVDPAPMTNTPDDNKDKVLSPKEFNKMLVYACATCDPRLAEDLEDHDAALRARVASADELIKMQGARLIELRARIAELERENASYCKMMDDDDDKHIRYRDLEAAALKMANAFIRDDSPSHHESHVAYKELDDALNALHSSEGDDATASSHTGGKTDGT